MSGNDRVSYLFGLRAAANRLVGPVCWFVALTMSGNATAFQDAGCTDPCDDGDVCTFDDICVEGVCIGTPFDIAIPFGDITPNHGVVDMDDVRCVVETFANGAATSCGDGDIAGIFPNVCGPNDSVGSHDVVAVVDAFGCAGTCPDTCPVGAPIVIPPVEREVHPARATTRGSAARDERADRGKPGGTADGGTRVFLLPDSVEIASVDPTDYSFVVALFVENTVSAGLGPVRSYQMALPVSAAPFGSATGSVNHDPFPPESLISCPGGLSPCVDSSDPQQVFPFGGVIFARDAGDCGGSGSGARLGAVPIMDSDAVDVVEPRYLGEFAYTASLDASGDFSITIQEPDVGDFGESFIRAEPAANIPFDFDDPGVLVSIPACACLDGSTILGVFTKFDCINNQGGTQWGLPYGDVTPVFGVVDFDDVLCVLNGFSNVGDCPQGDIAGDVQTPCVPNGVIDFDDVLAVLNAFADNSACPGSCGA